MYTHIYTHIYMYIYIYVYAYMYMYVYIYIYIYVCVCIGVCMYVCMYVCIYIYIYMFINVGIVGDIRISLSEVNFLALSKTDCCENICQGCLRFFDPKTASRLSSATAFRALRARGSTHVCVYIYIYIYMYTHNNNDTDNNNIKDPPSQIELAETCRRARLYAQSPY